MSILLLQVIMFLSFRPESDVKYCDQRVRMCVCLSVCLSVHSHILRTICPYCIIFVQARAVTRSFSDDYDVRYAHRDAVWVWDVEVWGQGTIY